MMTSKTLIIAAFFAVCSSSCTAQNNDEKNAPLYGKTINIIGDSYVANHRRPKEETWHSMVASKYGMTAQGVEKIVRQAGLYRGKPGRKKVRRTTIN